MKPGKNDIPISFYSWDLNCIIAVLSMALDNKEEYGLPAVLGKRTSNINARK
ncbi:MAG: hypothetical protein R8L53_03620 [Mariprofundales bacterium]